MSRELFRAANRLSAIGAAAWASPPSPPAAALPRSRLVGGDRGDILRRRLSGDAALRLSAILRHRRDRGRRHARRDAAAVDVLAVYGIITQQDIGKLFIAGIMPGLLAMRCT
jgi:hypothetical protein